MVQRAKKPPVLTPIPQPEPVALGYRVWFRSRRFCLTLADWQALETAFRSVCPYVRYNRTRTQEEARNRSKPPAIRVTEKISDQILPNGEMPWLVTMTFNPDWRLEYDPPGTPNRGVIPGISTDWTVRGPVWLPYIHIRNTATYRPASERRPEAYWADDINFAIAPDNPQHLAFRSAFFSLLGKFASNRHQVEVSYPDYRYFNRKTVTNLWIGHEARRWALEDPRRMLAYTSVSEDGPMLGGGVRPFEENWPERREEALAMTDPALLARSSAPVSDGLYHGPANAREAMIRRAMRAREDEGDS